MSVTTADLVSPAMACLRVSIHAPPAGQDPDQLQEVVAKVINAFLQTRWEWPRLFEQMTPYSFVLTDPRAERMDRRGLTSLVSELQLKLFGAEGEGEVSLLLFEGADIEVHRFARLSVVDIEQMLGGVPMNPPFAGLLDRIKPEPPAPRPAAWPSAAEPAPAPAPHPRPDTAADPQDVQPPPERKPPPPRAGAALEPVYGGLYLTMTHSFVGSIALCRRPRRDRHFPDLGSAEPLEDLAVEAFDEGCVRSAVEALEQGAAGLIAVPISFTSLVRPLGRRTYAKFLCRLPAEHRERLAAAVYDTPRAPTFSALQTIRRYLDPFFGEINLHVADPAFEVERLPPNAVASVVLALKDQPAVMRMAAIRRFAEARAIYKKKRIWPGVSAVATIEELEACLSLKIAVVGGPAVTDLMSRPPGVRSVALDNLPLTG